MQFLISISYIVNNIVEVFMEINVLLMILLVLASSTALGLMFWMALKNFGSLSNSLTYVTILSLLLSPVGAWAFSLFYKLNENIKALRSEKYKARFNNQ